jgi:hypothetical protein
LLVVTPASAQTPILDGLRLVEQGQYEPALRILLPEYLSRPTGPVAYAVGRAYDGLRDEPRALRFYTQALSHGSLETTTRQHARRRKRVLTERLRNRPQKATLSIQATATGAAVLLDGDPIGRTPLSGVLVPPGRHVIRVEHENYDPWERTVTLVAFEPVHFDVRMTDKPTSVLVNTEPAGATASIPGSPPCITPCLFALRQGTYSLTLAQDGYQTLVHEFPKPPGDMLELRLQLVPLGGQAVSASGFLLVQVDQAGAQIQIDGRVVGISPMTQPIAIATGAHQVTVLRGGYRTHQQQVQVSPGQMATVSVLLQRGSAVQPQSQPQPQPQPQPLPFQGMSTPTPAFDQNGPDHTWAWVLIGSGTGLILGGGGLLGAALYNQHSYDTTTRFKIGNQLFISGYTQPQVADLEQTTKVEMISAYTLFGVGAAALTTGLVLLFMDETPEGDALRAPSLGLSPLFGPGLTGAAASVRF